MCAQYLIKANLKALEQFFGLKESEVFDYPERIFPYSPAPVITKEGLTKMQYSLVPSWSKEPKVKFATYNARIETVIEKPTWREPFKKHHCLIPMTGFIESIDEGEYKDQMVEFYGSDLLVVAGIFDEWVDRKTGEVLESFAMLMTEPTEFIRNVGHDRQPIFLKEKEARKWLTLVEKPETMKEFLMSANATPSLEVRTDRWKKSAGKS